ncbi:hypothetical protein QFZ71_004522 [Streptomyces sp. V2I9]|nr:hypothetical protein [Streptomyces sp. V2I9]
MQPLGVPPQGLAEGKDGGVVPGAGPRREDRAELPREVRARPRLVGEQRPDPRGDLHGGRQPLVGRARYGVEQPDVAENDTPMAYRKTDAVPEHPGLRGGGDADGPGGTGDAEPLEPGAHGRRGAAGQDRPGADRVHRRVVVAVVGSEGDQAEVAVLQGRRGVEEGRDLVDQFLVVACHSAILHP